MGWETRGRTNRYYTRSRRVGGRVVREYVGGGRHAQLTAQLDILERQQREEEAERLRSERDLDCETERALIDYCKTVDRLLAAALTSAGYHRHKGQWRRKRGTEETTS
jgi:hypothetical protein